MDRDYPATLPAGYRFEEFEIVRVLGQGGFAITYLAKDSYRDQEVALKEYFPTGYAVRARGMRVRPAPGSHETFDWGYRRFLDEARVQAKFRHPNIPALHRYFRANGTAYVAMENVRGSSLSEVVASRGCLPLAEWRPWLDRLLDALEHVHGHKYLHRDITPSNILIRESEDQPVLIDFGAARVAAGERTRTVVLTEAYAPIEQHSKRAKQGPFTDIYSLAAVSYRVLSGEVPPSAPDRAMEDEHVPLARRVTEAPEWMATVDRALAPVPKDRPQTVTAWRKELNAAAAKMWLQGEPAAARDTAGLTALHRAAAEEQLPEVIALLLDDGADIDAAAGSDDFDAEFALEYADIDPGATPLHRAAAVNPNADVAALLLDRGANIHAKAITGETPLHVAAEQNSNAAVAGVLLDRGADVESPDSLGMTPLHLAARADRRDVVDLLLDRGACVDEFALKSWDRALLRFARANHKDASECFGTTPLHAAAEGNAVSVTSLLLDHGADVNARDRSGKTPLHLAAQHNALGVMELLTESGADPWASDLVGRTPLHMASWGNARGTVQSLLRRGAGHQSDCREQYRMQHWNWNDGGSAEQIVDVLAEGKLLPLGWTGLRPVAEMLLHAGNTPLHWAAFGDSREVAEVLLNEGAYVHGGKSEGPTPLDFAALGNATGTARLLVDRGADVSGRDDHPATPLHWAALGNACETMALLIDRGADTGARRPLWTPIFFAALGNARKAMELLLAEGAELGPHNTSGSVASPWGDWRETREGFVAHDRESDTDTLLHWASLRNATDVVELLLDRGTDLEAEDGEGRTPLDYAAQGNAVGAVERLLDRGADIGASGRMGYTPLHSAVRANATDAAQLLLDRGAEVQAGQSDVGTPLHMAQSAEIASLLLDRDADIEATDRDGNTPLHSAAFRNTADVVDVLLNQGATIDGTNHNGNTPLHLAASVSGDYDAKPLVARLLKQGADISAVNAQGKASLVVAMESRARKTVVECLLEYGADIKSSDRHGSSPLHLAARYQWPETGRELIALLLERGADVDVQDDRGRTPLHIAAETIDSTGDGGLWLAQFLIDQNANIYVRDKAGRTALERLQRSVAAIDAPGVHSEAVESFRIHPRSSVRQLFSGK